MAATTAPEDAWAGVRDVAPLAAIRIAPPVRGLADKIVWAAQVAATRAAVAVLMYALAVRDAR